MTQETPTQPRRRFGVRGLLASLALLVALGWVSTLPSSVRLARPTRTMPAAPAATPEWTRETPDPNPANLLRNTSLEYCAAPGVPDWWRPGEAWSDFRERNFGVEWELQDRDAKFHRSAVTLRNTRKENRAALDYPYMVVPDRDKPCVFSVYLRASRAGFPARIGIYGGFARSADSPELKVDSNSCLKPIVVGTEWKRYSVVSPKFRPGSTVRNRVVVLADGLGELTIDGLQLETGEKPTPYGPRPGDGPAVPTPSAADVVARRTLRPLSLDGAMTEREWPDAPRTEPFVRLGDGAKPDAETRARVLFDESYLYLGFVCEEAGEPITAASGVLESDHVEVFVSAQADGAGYRHYAVDVSGRVYASIGRSTAIETDAAGAARRETGRWTAELAIPWGELGLPPAAPDALRLNLARYRAGSGQWSSYSRAKDTMHEPRVMVALLGLDPRTLERYGTALPRLEARWAEGGATIEGCLELPAGARTLPAIAVTLGQKTLEAKAEPDGEGVVRFQAGPFAGKSQTRGTALVRVTGGDGRGTLGIHRRTELRLPPRCEVFLERSYYTSEDAARLVVLSHDPGLGDLRAKAEDGSLDQALEAPDRRGLTSLRIPVRGREPGALTFTVTAGGQTVGTAKLVVREPRPNEVKIDYLRRCLVVEGKPFLPVVPGWLAEENLRAVSDGSWNTVMHKRWHEPTGEVYSLGDVSDEALAALERFLDRAWRGKMRVLFHLPMKLEDNNCAKDEEAVRTLVEAFRDHPALLAWHTVDEPGPRATPEKLLSIANLVRDLDPYHPVWINEATFWQKSQQYCQTSQPACDLFSVDHYPIGAPGEGVPAMATWSERLNEACRWRKPFFMWLQAFGAIEWWSREPTPPEERAMTYLALVHESRGISYFVYRPRSLPLWEECRRLGREIEVHVAPVLATTVLSRPVNVGGDSVHAALLEQESGPPYLLMVNAGSAEAPVDVSPLVLTAPAPLSADVVLPAGLEVADEDSHLRFRLAAGDAALLRLRLSGGAGGSAPAS